METITAKWSQEDECYLTEQGALSDYGSSDATLWHSHDGDSWLCDDGSEPGGDFNATRIRLAGGPRDGETAG